MWEYRADRAECALDARDAFLRDLALHADSRIDRFAAQLVYTELVGNVIRHAPGPIHIQVSYTPTSAELQVRDHGRGFDLDPHLPENVLAECGRGLFLISQFSERVNVISSEDRGTCVSVVLPIER